MFDLVTPLQKIKRLVYNGKMANRYRDKQDVREALDDIQEICDETLAELNRLALLATTGKEAKT